MAAMQPLTVMAPVGHCFSQILQPLHPAAHCLRVKAPGSGERHMTQYFALAGISSIRCFGQTAAQAPQPVHLSASTTA